MKHFFILSVFLAMLPMSGNAQCNPNATTKYLCLGIEPNIGASFGNKGMRMNNYALDLYLGIQGRLNIVGSVEQTYNYYKMDDVKTYFSNTGLAGGLAYQFVKNAKSHWQMKAKMGSTIGHADWKNTFYDVSVSFVPQIGKSSSNGSLSVGYRYAHSRTEDIGHHNFIYFALGFGL
ncbi:MAG: hypothetical protein OSJ56_00130 [Prevotella sp.]|uniref:hypothetical protein n=1 Tax=Prevotella sp. PTAC TaxID=2736295 RepID=UPI0015516627|nr:hypothetical protein [Prevotella sp. PTAC]MCX4292452.1 hypothetical protein [Prevotella sp.]NPD53713.1 hypothetical protein [Prevotella sp. PTAC]